MEFPADEHSTGLEGGGGFSRRRTSKEPEYPLYVLSSTYNLIRVGRLSVEDTSGDWSEGAALCQPNRPTFIGSLFRAVPSFR